MSQPPAGDYLFTSESVTEGHPDKVADAISDAILDARSRTTRTPGGLRDADHHRDGGVAGEITHAEQLDYTRIVRDTVISIGYDNGDCGFDGHHCAVLVALDKQSPDIAQGVDQAHEHRDKQSDDELDRAGAGDQGMMFGYATDETPELMPMRSRWRTGWPVGSPRCARTEPWATCGPTARPGDGPLRDNVPVAVERVLISSQHAPEVSVDQIREDLWEHVVTAELPAGLYDPVTLHADLPGQPHRPVRHRRPGRGRGTDRAQDHRGYLRRVRPARRRGVLRQGSLQGGPLRRVRARHVAKNVVAAGLARRAEVQVAYAIGVARPVSVLIDTFGTERVSRELIGKLVAEHFDLRPAAFRDYLGLHRPIYSATSAYGHFGRTDVDLPWERTDRAAGCARPRAVRRAGRCGGLSL